jgi:hypothetical protein
MFHRIQAAALAAGLAVLWTVAPLLHAPYAAGSTAAPAPVCTAGGCAHEAPAPPSEPEESGGHRADHCGICHALALASCVEGAAEVRVRVLPHEAPARWIRANLSVRPARLPLHDAPARGPPPACGS